MNNIKTALISVWDKAGIVDLAKFLAENNIEIISTGGTKKILEKNNINVIPVSKVTQQNEVMNGRVKTLHPKIFGGILADRNNEHHIDDLLEILSRLLVLDLDGYHIFNIGTGHKTTVGEIIQIICKTLNMNPAIVIRGNTLGDFFGAQADIKKLTDVINYVPQISARNGIKSYVKWYRKIRES